MLWIKEIPGIGKTYHYVLRKVINRLGKFRSMIIQKVDFDILGIESYICFDKIWIDNSRYILTNTDYGINAFGKYYFVNIEKSYHYVINDAEDDYTVSVITNKSDCNAIVGSFSDQLTQEQSNELYRFVKVLGIDL